MKILIFFGTRPEAIKMAPVIHELKLHDFDLKICVSGQHREMLDQVLDFFKIFPDYDLNLMTPNQSLNSLSANLLREVDKVIEKVKPDIILVQGDTTTAFIAALAGFQHGIRIGHIETGLRTYHLNAPFPEEANRQLISRIAHFHFVPSFLAKKNLIQESISESNIFVTGNTVIDALLLGKASLANGYLNSEIKELQPLLRNNKKLILVTGHRRENFGKGIEEVCQALLKISQREDVVIIFPVHLNPRVKDIVYRKLENRTGIILTKPLNYATILWLQQNCTLIITDSGGVQEEAPSFGKPVLVTRDYSERMEGVKEGCAFLVGTNRKNIVEKTIEILDSTEGYLIKRNPYGDGRAASRIVEVLKTEVKEKK